MTWNPGIALHALVHMILAGNTGRRYWTGSRPLIYDGVLWTGGRVAQVDAPGGSQIGNAHSLRIVLADLTDGDVTVLKTQLGPAVATVKLIATEDAGATWTEVGQSFAGPVTSPALTGNEYTFEIAAHAPIADRGETLYWSHADRIRRVGKLDRGMAQMSALANQHVVGVWPQV